MASLSGCDGEVRKGAGITERAYIYKELPRPTSFRLFHLEPASPESPHIHGWLEESDLEDNPEYECE